MSCAVENAAIFAAVAASSVVKSNAGLGWVIDNEVVRTGSLKAGDEAALLLDRTNFYGEQGGQVGDTGTIRTAIADFEVTDTQRLGNTVLLYRATIDPPGYMPSWLVRSTFRREMPQMLTDLRRRCEAEQTLRAEAKAR